MTWKHPSSPVTKKFKVQRSAAKVMATVFWDAKGVILLDILPQGQCINAARYCSTLNRLKEAIRRKRPGLLRMGIVLQHNNATHHSANLTQQWLQRYVKQPAGPCQTLPTCLGPVSAKLSITAGNKAISLVENFSSRKLRQ
ncbi:histone-lysine N-methyltransferase SETMAR [Plakobranchus ocellatus]|uniref:Histone-lysine N-methyltransferase SETMAR n=1 Tax=Plakobranchus ocellatus TaxID=259542 RepID=A0AAV4C3N9_9GAST|nr:histone-lysine N-methyltransferase SETMAR [Plakobranchus ocellatus]